MSSPEQQAAGEPCEPGRSEGRAELDDDQRTERLIAWKGLLTVAIVVLIIVARQTWWV